MKWVVYYSVFILFLLGCSPARESLTPQSVYDSNQKAQNLQEWLASGQTPEKLFSLWRTSGTPSAEVCRQLVSLDSIQISLFEDEIRSEKNADLVVNCKIDLLEKLDLYWNEQMKRLRVEGNGAKPTTGVIPLDTELYPKIVNQKLSIGQVVLTFDDGPSTWTPKFLTLLKKYNVKAHFFLLGKSAKTYPETVKQMALDGHEIGNHSHSHACLAQTRSCRGNASHSSTTEAGVMEIIRGNQAIIDVLGWVAPFFRFPYGEGDAQLREYLKNQKMTEFFWSLDTEDWKAQSLVKLYRKTTYEIGLRRKAVILFHDRLRNTYEALEPILIWLAENKYEVVTYHATNFENGHWKK